MDIQEMRTFFVRPNEATSDIMQTAYQVCEQHGVPVEWISANECKNKILNKSDFIVFQNFEGEVFEEVQKKDCVRIVGPWCMLICLNEGISIPNLPWPIYNIAMRDCVVVSSHLSQISKQNIKEKVNKMGGLFHPALTSTTTHLITDSVKTDKYAVAVEKGIKIMLPTWIDYLWEKSLLEHIHSSQEEQIQRYKCLPFHKLTISSTGIREKMERDELENLVNNNGGLYTGKMSVELTDFLVCEGIGAVKSAKYKAARHKNVKCVSLQWIKDSVQKGYALPCENYLIKKVTSTPTKEHLNPNFSTISAICTSDYTLSKTTLQETIISNNSLSNQPVSKIDCCLKRKAVESNSERYDDLVNSIDIRKAKNAGPFLDGCGIYFIGFNAEQKEKLSKVINFSGATRYNDMSDRITHIIVGDSNSHDIKIIQSRNYQSALVTVQWLIDSINKKRPVPEEYYIVNKDSNAALREFSSPQSKKGFNLLRSNNTIMEDELRKKEKLNNVKCTLNFESEENPFNRYLNPGASEDSLDKFLQNENFNTFKNVTLRNKTQTPRRNNEIEENNIKTPQMCSTKNSSISSFLLTDSESNAPINDIFRGLKFYLHDDENYHVLQDCINNMGGEVLSEFFKDSADYTVLPEFIHKEYSTSMTLVNFLWVNECLQKEEICSIQYYHHPLLLHKAKPLNNCVITISGYSDTERCFLSALIKKIGGICQDQLARVTSAEKKCVASTHLLTCDTTTRKYVAALKWGLPIVNKDWLLECAKTGKHVPENLFSESLNLKDSSVSTSVKNVALNSEKNISANDDTTVKNLPSNLTDNEKTTTDVPPSNVDSLTAHDSTLDKACNQHVICALGNSEHQTLPVSTKLMASGSKECTSSTVNEGTPKNRNPVVSSQITPVSKIMEQVRKRHLLGTPENPAERSWDHVDTPETPLGAFIRSNPSPNLRKEMVRYLNQIPEWKPPQRRLSTPLSELKRRLWDKICPPKTEQNISQPVFDESPPNTFSLIKDNSSETPEKQLLHKNLEHIDVMLKASGGNKRSSIKCTVPVQGSNLKESQPCTVGWGWEGENDNLSKCSSVEKSKLFMLSGISSDDRENFTAQLQILGASVSLMDSYDPSSTHLICSRPARNEKTLSFMAAGKWILHTSYVTESVKAGRLLDEEEFEFGNPKSSKNIEVNLDTNNSFANKISAIHWWRKKIAKQGYGAFNDMRAILVAFDKKPIANVIQAGGGMVVEANPPFDDTIYATHCILEPKCVKDLTVYTPLAKKGIYCVSTMYIGEFLDRSVKDVRERVFPCFKKYCS